jgi:hypothetical protein
VTARSWLPEPERLARQSLLPIPPKDWLRKFEDRTIVAQRVRNLPLAQAERAAFDIILVEFLNATHPDTDPGRCAVRQVRGFPLARATVARTQAAPSR